jgi:predicted DNA-binding protein
MKRTNFFIPLQQLTALKTLSTKVGVSVSELVRRAIEDFLENKK